MDSEQKTLVSVIALLVTLLLGSFAIWSSYYTTQTKMYTDRGYTRTTIPGYNEVVWVLPDSTSK